MTAILFVDDERNVLGGLMRMLRKQRAWTLSFAESGAAALALLATQPIDVVVSDMRMPGMDGAELLAAVQRLYPHAARVVLSGHTEEDASIRALAVAHQFLAKPCDGAVLTSTLERLAALPTADRTRRSRAAGAGVLATPAARYDELMALLDGGADAAALARVIEHDVALAARVLHAVSSPFFGHAGRFPCIREGVVKLGASLLRDLAQAGALSRRAEGNEAARLERANAVAVTVAAAAAARVPERRGDAWAAGLLHDLGPWLDDDAGAGHDLLALWGLPELIVGDGNSSSASDLAVRAAVAAAAAEARRAPELVAS